MVYAVAMGTACTPASQVITAQHVTLIGRTTLVKHATLLDSAALAAGAASSQLAVLPCAQDALHLFVKNLYNLLKAWTLVWVLVPCSLNHALQCLKRMTNLHTAHGKRRLCRLHDVTADQGKKQLCKSSGKQVEG